MVEESQKPKPDSAFDEEIDPELLGLASSGQRGSILRPILFLVVIWFGASLIHDWKVPLSYFFSSSEPVEIGNVLEFATLSAQDPNFKPDIPHNRYVSLSGVPSRRSQSERFMFFKLAGSDVYVEMPREDADLSELERAAQANKKGDIDRQFFEGSGRALRLSEVPERYAGLRGYYFGQYYTYFCGMQLGEKEQRILDESGEECVDAYIVEVGTTPMSHWWYVLISGIIGIFIVLNIWWTIRWVRDFARS
ncbi:hypothetical protein [Bradymonas sediminis]|uniref:Uncharacterized protein n=1 Tax=Bradymonas sediminis TaxID=1548548 RepID=A0A2Z4FNS9_9DELT|nr:hypothetical protein [Bradymonas sediminis]AWV90701.1 hypothetical protein DN745_15815 [Bradymonas sediminis]TDP62658.1 hypothetical protein DFR33_11263 [Bradymonas sediminis]